MTALSAFYPWVAVDCPGAPNPVMDDAIRRGCREFCKSTHAITGDINITTVAATADYAPTLTSGTEILSLTAVFRPTSATLLTREYLVPKSQDWIDRQTVSSNDARNYAILDTDPLSIRLYPTPDAIETLTTKLVLMPTPTATTVDSRLFNWYMEGVVAYAKYWLQNQPDRPWTNTEEAAESYRKFDAQVADARVRRAQKRADLDTQVEMRPFA